MIPMGNDFVVRVKVKINLHFDYILIKIKLNFDYFLIKIKLHFDFFLTYWIEMLHAKICLIFKYANKKSKFDF